LPIAPPEAKRISTPNPAISTSVFGAPKSSIDVDQVLDETVQLKRAVRPSAGRGD
jgi:hypothetical protein